MMVERVGAIKPRGLATSAVLAWWHRAGKNRTTSRIRLKVQYAAEIHKETTLQTSYYQ